jgi:uncharacterized hydantoinase/oxoprolinase family protein
MQSEWVCSTKEYLSLEESAMAVVGWDIGGAHLKAARAENGRITAAIQVAAPLRLGLERLAQAFAEAKALIGQADCQAVTMTGELADTFSHARRGLRDSPRRQCVN